MENYYTILGCEENSTLAVIKKKYQELALKYHPDKAGVQETEKHITFQSINDIWKVLRDPEKRKAYDLELQRSYVGEQPLIFASLRFKDLGKGENGMYSYLCRCGGLYEIEKEELVESECLVPCNECSFNIVVTL